jgi:hypothetical protein
VGLHLTTIKASEQRPSNLAVYFKVETKTGEPIGGLTADQFRIYEDAQLVSQYESKQTILNPEVAAVNYTLLLVDMSGSITESGTGDTLVQAVGAFSGHIEKQQKVGIYAFDGGPDLYPIVAFTDQTGNANAGVQQLSTFKPKDPSTNLNGAIVKALDELDNALGKATQPLKFGTLVVFTDGTDRANRVPESTMRQHVKEKPFDVYAIGLGGELKQRQLDAIGKSGTAMATDRNAIVKAFDDVGARVEARAKSFYLLSYCSPSRAGKHVVRVEAVYKNPQGGSDRTGSLESDFDATGFAPGCDPSTPPNFDVSRGEALVAAPVDKEKEKEDKPDKGDKPAKSEKPEKADRADKKADKKVTKPDAKAEAKLAVPAPPPKPPPAPAAAPPPPHPAPPPAAAPPPPRPAPPPPPAAAPPPPRPAPPLPPPAAAPPPPPPAPAPKPQPPAPDFNP